MNVWPLWLTSIAGLTKDSVCEKRSPCRSAILIIKHVSWVKERDQLVANIKFGEGQ
jgi:hypothetical protein